MTTETVQATQNHLGTAAAFGAAATDVTLRRVFSSTSFFCTVSGGSGPVTVQHHMQESETTPKGQPAEKASGAARLPFWEACAETAECDASCENEMAQMHHSGEEHAAKGNGPRRCVYVSM